MSYSQLTVRVVRSSMLVQRFNQRSIVPTNILKSFSTARENVLFHDGRTGWIANKKSGWFSINVVDSASGKENIIKARKSEFTVVDSAIKDVNVAAITVPKQPEIPVEVPAAKEQPPFSLGTTPTPAMHAQFKNWIIFSDLHVKGSSIDSCEEVLAAVHDAAVQNNAGIIFLGDFWHVRGSLSVELLNRVMFALRKWNQPVIMIPGNHDQVTLGGAVHALEPLLYAFRPEQILMISEPTVCMGALWIPYRRDPALMKSILAAGASHPDVSMIYCHADVQGAFMNDGMRSREGLDIGSFPENLPIYSGHFHKPHTMTKNGSSLRYVGSPYQTSLSEAGQDKFLYCMSCLAAPSGDSSKLVWKEDNRWTISIGKKFIKATSAQDPGVQLARPGDRVVIPVRIGEDYEAEALSTRLRDRGVEVELRHERNSMPSAVSAENGALLTGGSVGSELLANGSALGDLGEIDPVRVFCDYMSSIDLSALMNNAEESAPKSGKGAKNGKEQLSDVARLALHSAVLEEGRHTVERLVSSSSLAGNQLGDSVKGGKLFNLKLDKLALKNFGPYGGEGVQYPLSERGLVLIRGQSTDRTGADSNGSGKTTLAMSVMWALSGSMDARLVADGRAADVAYDTKSFVSSNGQSKVSEEGKRTAEVSIWGTVNDKPFELVRRRGAKKSDLQFTLDGRNLTTQSVKDTQLVVDSELGIGNGLLQRCCFFGQHSHTLHSLLGLTDVKLKSELSALVSTDIWAAALQDVKGRDKLDKTRSAELAVETRMRGEELARLRKLSDEATATMRQLESQLIAAEDKVLAETGGTREVAVSGDHGESASALTDKATELQTRIESNKRLVIEPLRKEILQSAQNKTVMLSAIDAPISQLRERIAKSKAQANASQATANTTQSKLKQLVSQESNVSATLNQLMTAINSPKPVLVGDSGSVQELLGDWKVLAVEEVDSAAMRKSLEASSAQLTGVDVRLKAANKSLANITELVNETASSCSVHGQDSCPTCGQDMPSGTRESRLAELQASVQQLQRERAALVQVNDFFRKRYDAGLKVQAAADQKKSFSDRAADLRSELASCTGTLTTSKSELVALEAELSKKVVEKSLLEKELQRVHSEKTLQLAASEKETHQMELEEKQIRRKVEEVRKAEAVAMSSRGTVNAAVLGLQNSINAARNALAERATQVTSLENGISKAEQERKSLSDRSAVLERLVAVLGPRGIQNYVFQTVLHQIEGIANAYLTVLADGGIQLSLQGEQDVDKIVKAVMIRGAADGIFRERGLSQLSGGQWRRVSMALDLAFAEVIRRRGILRSNLIVMDEVLTHLDASGREAVGTVLRAMVEGPRSDTDDLDAGVVATDAAGSRFSTTSQLSSLLLGGGAYETVIVILQDLAAVELEEAFDCVDVVVKDADTARVVVDDGH